MCIRDRPIPTAVHAAPSLLQRRVEATGTPNRRTCRVRASVDPANRVAASAGRRARTAVATAVGHGRSSRGASRPGWRRERGAAEVP